MEEQNLMKLMELISFSGNGKSLAFEAIQLAKAGEISEAKEKMVEARESLVQAHHVQTDMLTEEARGNHAEVSLLAIHSQDHLMTAMTFMDIAQEFIDLYSKMSVTS